MNLASDRRTFIKTLFAGSVIFLPISIGAYGSNVLNSLLFINIKSISISKSMSNISTVGWNASGLGGGNYVSDKLARILFDLHPRFCARSKNGRYFRLQPDNGVIVVEQAGAQGDISGDGQINDRPAFQAALDYARAIGASVIGMSQNAYAIWVGERTTSPVYYGEDGHGIVVASDQQIELVGLTADLSQIRFLSSTGNTFDGDEAGVNLQFVDGKPWRGSGIHLRTHSNSDNPERSSLVLRNLSIDGGLQRDALKDLPSRLKWDVTNKGIYVEADHLGGSVSIYDCIITGWRGESVYCTNDVTQSLKVRNSLFANSNGQGLNPNGCKVDVENVEIRNCYIGIEGWTGAAGGRIIGTTIIDCFGINQSGGAFALQGGKYGRSTRSSYFAPTEVTPGEVPIGQIDITCQRCSRALLGWWLTGRLNLIDTRLGLGAGTAFNEGSQGVALDVSLMNESIGGAFVSIAGGSGTVGDMLTDNCALRISVSDAPDYAGLSHPPVVWYGSLGDNITVELIGAEVRPAPVAVAASLDYSPHFS